MPHMVRLAQHVRHMLHARVACAAFTPDRCGLCGIHSTGHSTGSVAGDGELPHRVVAVVPVRAAGAVHGDPAARGGQRDVLVEAAATGGGVDAGPVAAVVGDQDLVVLGVG